ncbi:MAG: hypothetical protein IT303_05930 [Dehalococcoidia bacterium]|nr:hypothetical protein [Dehalococcoidia bacterium]
MQIQVLTFRTCDVPAGRLDRYGAIVELAVEEFPGAVSARYIVGEDKHIAGGIIIWEDEQSLATFRHSEFYARLMLNPWLEDGNDRDFELDRGAAGTFANIVALPVAA